MIPPDPHSGRGRPPSALNTQRGLWPGAGRKHPVVGTQTLVPLNFSVVVVHWMRLQSMWVEQCVVLCCVVLADGTCYNNIKLCFITLTCIVEQCVVLCWQMALATTTPNCASSLWRVLLRYVSLSLLLSCLLIVSNCWCHCRLSDSEWMQQQQLRRR